MIEKKKEMEWKFGEKEGGRKRSHSVRRRKK